MDTYLHLKTGDLFVDLRQVYAEDFGVVTDENDMLDMFRHKLDDARVQVTCIPQLCHRDEHGNRN